MFLSYKASDFVNEHFINVDGLILATTRKTIK